MGHLPGQGSLPSPHSQTDRDLSWGQGLYAGVRESRRRPKTGREVVLTTVELWGEWDPTPQEGRGGEERAHIPAADD